MIERIKFCLSEKEFVYTNSGVGMAVESYNPLTDTVRVRFSQFGYVTNTTTFSRKDYLEELNIMKKDAK